MYSILNTLSEYTYFQKTLLHKIVESLQCRLKMKVLFSSDYCTVSKNMLLVTLKRLIFAWIYFPRILILLYVADGDNIIYADDDISIISWGSVVAVNKINNVYVFYNKRRGGTIFFSKITEDLNQYNLPLLVIQSVKKQNYFFKNVNRAKKNSAKNPRRFILGIEE